MKKIILLVLVCLLPVACMSASPAYLAPVESYLVENIGQAYTSGKVFCAYDVLGTASKAEGTDVYVWALCGEYYLNNTVLTLGTASSLPVALYEKNSDGIFTVIGYEIPSDGTAYMSDIQRIFPSDAIQAMCHEDANCYNERARRLESEIEQKAGEFYSLK